VVKKFRQICGQIIPDHSSEKLTKFRAWLTKLFEKKFSLNIHGMSVISNASNLGIVELCDYARA